MDWCSLWGGQGTAYAAESIYGTDTGKNDSGITEAEVERTHGGVTKNFADATQTGAEFEVKSNTWNKAYGGYTSGSGAATSNVVTISGSTASASYVYGGYAQSNCTGAVTGNTVTVTGGTVNNRVCGGFTNSKSELAVTTGNVTNNTVYITGGTVGPDGISGDMYGVYGGFVDQYGDGAVKGNKVTITGDDTVVNRYVMGGYVGKGGTGAVTGNTVTISGGTVNGNVMGGYVGEYGTGAVTKNEVIIKGGTVNGIVYGGYVGENGTGAVTSNTVTLGDENGSGVAKIKFNVYLHAKRGDYGSSAPLPGGTLNVYNSGNEVGYDLYAYSEGEQNATLNFYINPEDMNAGDKTMLTVGGTAKITGATINAGVRNVGEVKAGDKITLLQATTLTADETLKTGKLTDGIMDAELAITKEGNKIIATASKDASATANETAKSPVETMAASVTLLNAGADMVAGESFGNAAAAVAQSQASGSSSTMAPFASMGGSSLRVESGSYCDVKSWNINLGFAKEVTNKQGRLMFGPIIEYGRGSYDSYLDNGTHGDGTNSFVGIGVMAKQSNTDGLYYEGSLRGGRAKSDYSSNFTGSNVSYDTAAPYYAAHVGVGKVQPVGKDGDTLDYYGKLFYSHQNGDRASLSNGYDYDFKAVDSFRSRLGLRYNHKVNAMSTIYGGLAWQHEFDGKAEATGINTLSNTTFEAPAPSVKGDTGILELGWKVKPGKGNFETGLGFTGSIGKQKGVGLNASFQWSF